MTQQDKELLLKDLCARLPYGVKIQTAYTDAKTLEGIQLPDYFGISDGYYSFDYMECNPYLFPLSSMTEEQRKEYHNLCSVGTDECGDIIYFDTYESIDYLNKNKFDYRYLIPMGLAIDATGKNIY